ncbi:MAG: GNAT family N-acetyltransferase [Bacteroidetes bacterium GWA2_30_7]|nr:MAG: GNAT family N-acetyltransferase [Bacteroidetes bacterium GWA2_30_7]
MNIKLVDIKENDFEAIKEIYDYYILNTTNTFNINSITIDELKSSVLINHDKYKSYLIKANDIVCGYCYLSQFRKKQAYDSTAEVTIYLHNKFSGNGIGFKAVSLLEKIAKDVGIKILMAYITAENTNSIKLFKKLNYELCGNFKNVGYKFNKYLDVLVFEKELF